MLLRIQANSVCGADEKVAIFQAEMQAFAAGSFMFLVRPRPRAARRSLCFQAMHEISDQKCCSAVAGSYQVLLMLGGLGAMALLAVWV